MTKKEINNRINQLQAQVDNIQRTLDCYVQMNRESYDPYNNNPFARKAAFPAPEPTISFQFYKVL